MLDVGTGAGAAAGHVGWLFESRGGGVEGGGDCYGKGKSRLMAQRVENDIRFAMREFVVGHLR